MKLKYEPKLALALSRETKANTIQTGSAQEARIVTTDTYASWKVSLAMEGTCQYAFTTFILRVTYTKRLQRAIVSMHQLPAVIVTYLVNFFATYTAVEPVMESAATRFTEQREGHTGSPGCRRERRTTCSTSTTAIRRYNW